MKIGILTISLQIILILKIIIEKYVIIMNLIFQIIFTMEMMLSMGIHLQMRDLKIYLICQKVYLM